MDTLTIFENILEDSNKNHTIFTTIQTIINLGNRELKSKKMYWRKKKNQIKMSNYTEEEFRKKEMELLQGEKEEIKEIK